MAGKSSDELFPGYVELRYERLNNFASDFGELPRRLCESRNVFIMIYIHQGSGHCLVDNQYIALHEGGLLLVEPFAYLHLVDVRLVLGNVILFTEEFFCRTYLHESLLYRTAFEPGFKTFFQLKGTDPAKNFFKSSFRAFGMEYRFGKEEEIKKRILVCHLYGFILYLHKLQLESMGRTYDVEGLPEKDKAIGFIRLVNRHFREKQRLDFYAAKLFVSAKALSGICQKAIGVAAKDIIHAAVLAEAKRMLIYGTESIENISHELGYSERSFKAFFIRQVGLSPKAFRVKILTKLSFLNIR